MLTAQINIKSINHIQNSLLLSIYNLSYNLIMENSNFELIFFFEIHPEKSNFG